MHPLETGAKFTPTLQEFRELAYGVRVTGYSAIGVADFLGLGRDLEESGRGSESHALHAEPDVSKLECASRRKKE